MIVEVVDQELDAAKLEREEVEARWARAGRRLRELDPARFRRVFALAEAFVAAYEREDESDELYEKRRALIAGVAQEVN